jgi:stage II sporulation protein D
MGVGKNGGFRKQIRLSRRRSPMSRFVIVIFSLLIAAPSSAQTVRVRLAKTTKTLHLKGTLDCAGRKVSGPRARALGSRLQVNGSSVAKGLCKGAGRFVYRGTAWDGGAELRLYGGALILVASIDMEKYIAGVVAAELLPGWPVEALKAMSVAARSYTLWRIGARSKAPFDLTADVSSQVFRGLERVPQPVRDATRATRRQVLRYKGKPISAYYHACAAGRTATAGEVWGKDQPYLQSVVSPDLACNRINWRAAMHVKVAGKKLGVGELKELRITGFTVSHRVKELQAVGTKKTRLISAQALRKVLGWAVLRSADFTAEIKGRQLVIHGHGSGHGVGMSQWGAKGLAERGKSYTQILEHYYPGAKLR